MTGNGGIGVWLRAGSAVFATLVARTGPRGRRPARLLLPAALLSVGGLGAVAGAAAVTGQGAAEGMPAADRARIEAVVRDYILAHPEIIPQAIERLQAREMTNAIDDHRAALETPYAGAWEGAANGDVTLVEFYDYACGYCRTARPDVERLLAEDKGLKVVYRQLPILGPTSVMAGRVGLLAAEQGRYPAFHRAMFSGQSVDKAAVQMAAAKAGLDRAKVDAVLGSRTTPAEFEQNVKLAQALQAKGTPLFVVGGSVLNGAVGYDALKAAVAEARAKRLNPAG